jgi:LmbE family N-acetylglucosaminyl deacetylase
MRYNIVAHPDDECIWFNPEEYDKIVIVFTDRSDVEGFGAKRKQALEEHPLKEKIVTLDLVESNYWRDVTKIKDFEDNYHELCEWLEDNIKEEDTITTHDANGEYGHLDHNLVHTACMNTVDVPVNNKDPKLYREIRDCYVCNGVWTWALTESIY